jgi:hypothetical protein
VFLQGLKKTSSKGRREIKDKRLFFVIFAILWAVGSVIALSQEPEKPQKAIGGPCEYKQYKGKATIVSIREKPTFDHLYEVYFSFSPDEEIEESWVKVEGRRYLLMLNNSSYPGRKFLKKYGIKLGKTFNCYLKVITKGSCTPILFEFPTINLGDYFESRK